MQHISSIYFYDDKTIVNVDVELDEGQFLKQSVSIPVTLPLECAAYTVQEIAEVAIKDARKIVDVVAEKLDSAASE